MLHPTQEDINDAIVALVRSGVVVAFEDDAGQVRLAPIDWAQTLPPGAALSADEVATKLTDATPGRMARWN